MFLLNFSSNLVKINLPWEHRLSWQPAKKTNSFSCHLKVKNSLERVLNKVFDYYGNEKIKDLRLDYWGGCFNKRPIRGGSRPSMHSWGIAIDYDPVKNKLNWGRDKALFAKPEYFRWWEIWEEEGWVSLGRKRNYDWMHIQAAKI